MLTWDNSIMGLRDEVRLEGVLVQTHFGPVFDGKLSDKTATHVRYGLRSVA